MFAALLAISIAAQCDPSDEPSLPLVYEQVDQIWFVTLPSSEHTTVVFIKNSKVLATRYHNDEMLLVAVGCNWQLVFRDYWQCERVVECSEVRSAVLSPLQPADDGQPWFGQGRIMTDLRAPPVQP